MHEANDHILHPILKKFVVIYFDDILVYSKCLEENIEHLKVAI